MIGIVWSGLFLVSIAYGLLSGRGPELAPAAMAGAAQALDLLLSMAGVYMVWLGVMEIAQRSGLTEKIAHWLSRPLLFLFPELKRNPDGMGKACMNLSANMLGMGNAATPFGLSAMESMQTRNPDKKRATGGMVMLIVVNCSAVQIIPTTIIALRAAAGSVDPGGIFVPILLSTLVTTAVGILACKILQKGA